MDCIVQAARVALLGTHQLDSHLLATRDVCTYKQEEQQARESRSVGCPPKSLCWARLMRKISPNDMRLYFDLT
jgi:hypothetical protein